MSAVVLVEGPSDAVVLRELACRLGLDGPDLSMVSMGGVTNFAQHLRTYAGRPEVVVTGLCDGAEVRFLAGALRRAGHDVGGRADLERLGFFVCDGDLEDELIRALGPARVQDVIEAQGELRSLRRFQDQPAQRDRELTAQLRRFLGTRSGRKAKYARLLAEAVELALMPAPLVGVLGYARRAATPAEAARPARPEP